MMRVDTTVFPALGCTQNRTYASTIVVSSRMPTTTLTLDLSMYAAATGIALNSPLATDTFATGEQCCPTPDRGSHALRRSDRRFCNLQVVLQVYMNSTPRHLYVTLDHCRREGHDAIESKVITFTSLCRCSSAFASQNSCRLYRLNSPDIPSVPA
ncbi:hypothetical protein BC835DRAFT_117285 [Cytidiella melzeri]|nr:hypothetical protein BC835DRAFT_117285 [Cytidiella melzeri]